MSVYYRKIDEAIYSAYQSRILLKEEAQGIKRTDKMDPELEAQFKHRLDICKAHLYRDFPWYGILLSKLHTVPTYDIDTMAVDNFGNIYMNPEFTMKMTPEETMGVLAHECMHIMTLSFFRQHSRDMKLWNIATDFMMNLDLVEMKMSLPEGGCIPEERGGRWFAVIPRGDGQPDLEYDITDLSAEELYDKFEKDLDKDKEQQKQSGKKDKKPFKVGDRVQSRNTGKNGTIKKVGGLPPNQTLEIDWDNEVTEAIQKGVPSSEVMPLLSGEVEMDPNGDQQEGEDFALDKDAKIKMKPQQGKPSPSKGQTSDVKIKGDLQKVFDDLAAKREKFDKHITSTDAKPTPLDTGDPDLMPNLEGDAHNQLKDKVQSAMTAIGQRGLSAGGPRSFQKNLQRTKTNWRNLLRNFLSAMERSRPTWSKPKKRAFAAGYYAPGLRKERKSLDVVVAIDTSGSISDRIIGLFVSEIFNISKAFPKVQMKIILWHTTAYADIDIDTKKVSPAQVLNMLNNLPYEGGGTELTSVKAYLDKEYPNEAFGGIIVFTDGYVEETPSFPKLSDQKNKLFLLTPDGDDKTLKKYGTTVKIDVYQ